MSSNKQTQVDCYDILFHGCLLHGEICIWTIYSKASPGHDLVLSKQHTGTCVFSLIIEAALIIVYEALHTIFA